MKKLQFFSILLLGGLNSLNAQITYNSNDFTSVGQTFQLVNISDAVTADFSQTGADFNWDFSDLTQAAATDYGYEDPNNSPFKNIWCLYHLYIINCGSKFNENFNMGMAAPIGFDLGEIPLSDPYQHLLKSSTALQNKMFGVNAEISGTSLPVIIEYSDPDDVFRFPMNYNNSYTDTNSIAMDFSALGINLTIQSEGTRTNVVEGWGSLKIPNYEFGSVLKVKSTLDQTIHISYEGTDFDVPVTMVSYYWFDKDYGIPVLSSQGTEVAGFFVPALTSYLYFQPNMGLTDLSKDSFMVYPNPTTGIVNVKLMDSERIKAVQVFDQSGKIVSKKLDLSALPKGVYVLKVQTTQRNIQQKVIKK